ncbi:MAG: CAP domain-containing protein, partial [Planctomycetia bacterium]
MRRNMMYGRFFSNGRAKPRPPAVDGDRFRLETLEGRDCPAVTAQEQLFVYLLNRARNNPQAYQREQRLPVSLAGVARQAPLAVNNQLSNSSKFKTGEMAQFNYFAHTSQATGEQPNALARRLGYDLPDFYQNDANFIESIGAGPTDARELLNLFIVDEGINPPGHRIHLLALDQFFRDHREIGVGVQTNSSSTFGTYWAVHTANVDPSDKFLTGVAFRDRNGNSRYDLNEGINGARVKVGSRTVRTNAAGGWSMKVGSDGRYNVRVEGTRFGRAATATAVVRGKNVAVDFIAGQSRGFVNFRRSPAPAASAEG